MMMANVNFVIQTCVVGLVGCKLSECNDTCNRI
jgi:hypothetical protein